MGLVSYFKKKFSKDIKLEQDVVEYLVFPFKAKNNRIVLNHKAIVPENSALIFASKGKVLDCLPAGETMMGAITLPKCSKKFGLYKLNRFGGVPKDFVANAYFISLAEQKNFKFSTYKKLRYKNEKDGRFWVDINFEIDFKVVKPEKFLQNLLVEYSYLKYHESETILSDLLSESVTDKMLRTDYMRSNFQENKNELLQVMFLKVKKSMESYGCELLDLRFSEIKMSKNRESKKTKFILEKLEETQQKSTFSGLEKLEIQEVTSQTAQPQTTEPKAQTPSTFVGLENKEEYKSSKRFVELE